MALPSEEFCPVPDSLLGRLYRSTPEGLAVLVKTVPPATRAMLAYYCSRRAHLEALGLSIAATCSAEDLYDVAGRAGWSLFERAQAAKPPEAVVPKNRRGIALAPGPMRRVPDASGE